MRPTGGIAFLQIEDIERAGNLLRDFLAGSGARCAVLLDRGGQLLARAGDLRGMDETAFATLAAADFAASDQLALLLGEQEFASLYHHGEEESMVLVAVGGRAIAAVVFDARTTLGMVRMRLRSLAPELAALLEAVAERGGARPVSLDLGHGWVDEAGDEIDRLFTD